MPVSTSPADELAQLKEQLETKQKESTEKAKEVDHLKAQIATLSKTVGEIDQKTKAYEKAAAAASDQVKDLTTYVKTETTMLKAALPSDSVAAVEAAKAAALKKIDDLKNKLTEATKKASEADTAYTKAKEATVAAQAAYKAVADLPSTNDTVVKDLIALKALAEKQNAPTTFARMYFVLLVMADRLTAIKPLTPEEYKKQLDAAGTALQAASDAEADAKEALDTANANQKQAQKDLDDARAKWRQETLESIPPGAPSAAPPTGSAGYTRPTTPAAPPPAG